MGTDSCLWRTPWCRNLLQSDLYRDRDSVQIPMTEIVHFLKMSNMRDFGVGDRAAPSKEGDMLHLVLPVTTSTITDLELDLDHITESDFYSIMEYPRCLKKV
jgi:hypothetical protein